MPASGLVEHALAEGARLLEGGVHQLFHPARTAAFARIAAGAVGEFAHVLALPDDPPSPLQMCGRRISEMYFWVPQGGSMGLGLSVLTYAGRVHFGVIAYRALLPEPVRLATLFAREFEKLLLAAAVGVAATCERLARRMRRRARPASDAD